MTTSIAKQNSAEQTASEQEPFIDEFYFYLLIHAHSLLSKHVDVYTAEENVSRNEFKVLVSMVGNPGLSLGQLAEIMQIQQSTLSRMIDRMVGVGLIERKAARGNRRSLALNLTSQGKAKAAPLVKHGTTLNTYIETVLGPKDSGDLKRILKRIISNERDVATIRKPGDMKV
jgi:MarR family transcriptional regulator, organic hydroperoxide resistance regulator